jgi:hypothetical protein
MQNQDRLLEQIMQLDMNQNNILTVQALAQAADAGKANLKANDLENVEEVLEDIADQNTEMAQMQDALAMPTGMMAELDNDELDAELEVCHKRATWLCHKFLSIGLAALHTQKASGTA